MTVLSIATSIINAHAGNFTPVTAVWTILGIVGMIFTALNLRDAILDLEKVAEAKERTALHMAKVQVAKSSVRQDVIRLLQMVSVVAVGIVVTLSTPAISDAQRAKLHLPYWTPVGIALTVALLLIVAGAVIQAVMDRRLRKSFG